VLVVGLISWLANSPAMKGRAGEARLRRELDDVLCDETFSFLHDLTLPDYDGTCQIDHVLVSPFGVFVIETKNYNGWIFGSERNRMWTHTFHRKKYQFQNPLHQNYNHVKTVQALTRLRSDQIHSLVVFTGRGEFKTPIPSNVIKVQDLRRYFFARSDVRLAPAEIESVVQQIQEKSLEPGFLTNISSTAHQRGGADA
jgi:hypothetical protein